VSEGTSVACVVVTYDAMPWIEQCLESVVAVPTVVVDNGSRDDTVPFVKERFPEVTVTEFENRGLAAGWNRAIAETDAELILVLNADAWPTAGSLARLVATAESHPEAAVVAPRLRNLDGTLQRSVRGFPTPWRLATEYLYLRKLAPSSRLLNAFYGAGFDHDEERAVDWVMGACILLRRAALDDVGPFDERYFLFSEEVDWLRRASDRGWSVIFTPEAECVHVGGAAHGGLLLKENVKGQLRYLQLHEGQRAAARGRSVMRLGLRLRSCLHRDARAAQYREVADWLGSGPIDTLLAE